MTTLTWMSINLQSGGLDLTRPVPAQSDRLRRHLQTQPASTRAVPLYADE